MTGLNRLCVKILPYICVAGTTLYLLFEFTDVEKRIKTFKRNYGLLNGVSTRANSLYVIHRVKNESIRSFRQYDTEEFAEDNIPSATSELLIKNDTIHICVTIGGAEAARESRFLLRSLYVHARRNNLYFHFLVTGDAKRILQKYLYEFKSPAVNILYEFVRFDFEFVKKRAKSVHVRISHHSGVYGMSKSFMYAMLSHVEKCLILDTDLVFGTDPAFLWSRFNDLEPAYFGRLKLGKNQNDMCSGVMLQRFSEMRKSHFDSFYNESVPKFCNKTKGKTEYTCRFGDQSMIYAAQLRFPLFKDLEDSWTLELCREFRGHSFRTWRENDQLFFGIVHFNCLQVRRKLQTIGDYMVRYKDSGLGRYLEFLDNLGRRDN